MTDIGTVRLSPNGVVAVYRGPQSLRGDWATSAEVDGYFDISDRRVADWKVVYTPPSRPIGTVMRRETSFGWQVAVRTSRGWLWVGEHGDLLTEDGAVPTEDTQGPWGVLHGPVVGARAD